MQDIVDRVRARFAAPEDCECTAVVEDGVLVVDADDCPGDGDLAGAPDCRAAAVRALEGRAVDAVRVETSGTRRRYRDRTVALLVAASRFAVRIADRDARLATRARRDPLAACREAVGRAGPVADAAAVTGLAAIAESVADGGGGDETSDCVRAFAGPTVARGLVDPSHPVDAALTATRDAGRGTVRVYDVPGEELPLYHLEPVAFDLDWDARDALARARGLLGDGTATDPFRAVERATSPDRDRATLAAVLRRHTRGLGVLEALFADDGVSDVYAAAPVEANPVRVVVDGTTMRTNVHLTERAAATLASRLRRTSGRALSRADPALDASVTTDAGDAVRAAALTDPLSDGHGFAFRADDDDPFTLPELVVNGTLPARAAALLSLAVERGAAVLVAGARGAGKTTLLGALCWELPAATRLVTIEDTPELPVDALQDAGRDVQALHADPDGSAPDPVEALRTALRLGEGALAVGEVRGAEAAALYEAMRVGANASAVLGTIHGDQVAGVRERVVDDLGVPGTSFAATDLVATAAADDTGHSLAAVEEVLGPEHGDAAPLFERGDGGLAATGRLARGNSSLLAALAGQDETYSDVLAALEDRRAFLARLADEGLVAPDAVVAAHARRRTT